MMISFRLLASMLAGDVAGAVNGVAVVHEDVADAGARLRLLRSDAFALVFVV